MLDFAKQGFDWCGPNPLASGVVHCHVQPTLVDNRWQEKRETTLFLSLLRMYARRSTRQTRPFFFPGTGSFSVPRAPQILRRQIEKNARLMYIFSRGRCTKNHPLFRSPSAPSLPRHAHSAQSFATSTSPCVVRSMQGARTFEEILLCAASLSSCPTYCRRSSWLLQAWPSLAVRIESGTAARAGQAGMAGRPCLCVEISSEQTLLAKRTYCWLRGAQFRLCVSASFIPMLIVRSNVRSTLKHVT